MFARVGRKCGSSAGYLVGALAAAVLALGAVAPAHAVLITVEPDDFAAGTDISSATLGVTLSAFSVPPLITGGVPSPAVLANSNFIGAWAPTGSLVFGTTATHGFRSSWYTGDHHFRADFTNPTDFVSILTGPDALSDTDVALFEIFDSANNLLDSFIAANVGTGVALTSTTLVSFSRLSPDIAYLIVRNPDEVTGESFVLDHLVFNAEPIPEPGTMLLLGSGLAGLALRRRRRS